MEEPGAEERGSQVVPQQVYLAAKKLDHQEQPGACPASHLCPLMVEHVLQWMPEG